MDSNLGSIDFLIMKDEKEHLFTFDFRYYQAYNGRQQKPAGHYIFKTPNPDSISLQVELKKIAIRKGLVKEEFMFEFVDLKGSVAILSVSLSNKE